MSSASRSAATSTTTRTMTRRPVFIGGCPRSGTTLLGAMLGVGPSQLTVPEAMFKFALLARADRGRIDRRAARHVLETDRRFDLWRVPTPTDAEDTEDTEDTGTVALAGLLDQLVAAFARRVDKPDATLWIDHTPGNIRFADALLGLYPDARIINLVRDGRGVAASVLPLDWGPNRMADAAPWWATHVAMGLALEARHGTSTVRTVRFEDLVQQPHDTLRSLCDFLEISYDPAMVTRRDYKVDEYTVTDHHRVSDIPDPSRTRAWMSVLSTTQLEEFEYHTGELARYLGYPLLVGAGAQLPSRPERLLSFLTDVSRRGVVDRVRRRRSERRPR